MTSTDIDMYLSVHKFSDTLNLVILHHDEVSDIKFSNFMNFVNRFN